MVRTEETHMPKLPEVYTELLGAMVFHDNDKAWKFMFGGRECWAPKSISKMIDMRLQVKQWFAIKKADEWGGQFVIGSQRTRMRAMDDAPLKAIEDAVARIDVETKRELDNIRRALAIYRKGRNEEVPDPEA
jgi:hypothetical protein